MGSSQFMKLCVLTEPVLSKNFHNGSKLIHRLLHNNATHIIVLVCLVIDSVSASKPIEFPQLLHRRAIMPSIAYDGGLIVSDKHITACNDMMPVKFPSGSTAP